MCINNNTKFFIKSSFAHLNIDLNMNINATLKDVEKENIIWLIFLFIIGANFVSNYYVEKYCYTNDEVNRKIYRTLNIIVLSIALGIYIFYVYNSYQGIKKDTNNELYKKLLFLASILILIGGAIYLGVEIYKTENPEISIN